MMMDGGPATASEEVRMGLVTCYECGKIWVDDVIVDKKPCRCRESTGWSAAEVVPDVLVTWDEKIEP
jgi:hypothetical protein